MSSPARAEGCDTPAQQREDSTTCMPRRCEPRLLSCCRCVTASVTLGPDRDSDSVIYPKTFWARPTSRCPRALEAAPTAAGERIMLTGAASLRLRHCGISEHDRLAGGQGVAHASRAKGWQQCPRISLPHAWAPSPEPGPGLELQSLFQIKTDSIDLPPRPPTAIY